MGIKFIKRLSTTTCPNFWLYERRIFYKACSKTKATVKDCIKGILFTIFIPIGVAVFIYLFPAAEPVFNGGGLMQEWIVAIVGIALFIAFVFGVFMKNLILAPFNQDRSLNEELNEKEQRIRLLEVERIPHIEVKALVGKPQSYDRSELTTWAELEIRNTSSSIDLTEVSVKIIEATFVYEDQDGKGKGTGTYQLHRGYPNWSPSNVYWSGRTGQPDQFRRPINRLEKQYATIAYHHKLGNALAPYNILTKPNVLESKILVEISSPIWLRG